MKFEREILKNCVYTSSHCTVHNAQCTVLSAEPMIGGMPRGGVYQVGKSHKSANRHQLSKEMCQFGTCPEYISLYLE